MVWLSCPYLGGSVELTEERERHIRRRHSNVRMVDVSDALADPGRVIRRPWRLGETLFAKEVDDRAGGTHIVVAVVTDEPHTDMDLPRHWVATAYLAAALPDGLVIWERN